VLKIKVEFLLPLLDNDGNEIEVHKYNETYDELGKKFKGYTIDQSPLLGNWVSESGEVFSNEEHYGVWVVCRNNQRTESFGRSIEKY